MASPPAQDGPAVSDELARLLRDYEPSFLAYLMHRDEAGLRSAYELGRQAMSSEIGLQDLAHAASAFLAETLASFEMTQRGFMGVGVGVRPEQHEGK